MEDGQGGQLRDGSSVSSDREDEHSRTSTEVSSLAAEDPGPTLHVEARYSGPDGGWDFATFDPVHKRLFSVCSNEKMVVVDAESGKVLASPAIGKGVDGAAFDPAGFALSSNGDGTMTVVSTKDDKFEVAQTLATAARARTIVIDPKTRRIYLPTAEFEPAKEASKDGRPARPTMKPGTFKIVVVTP